MSLGIKEELENTIKCKICKGLTHPFSRDFDHKDKLENGGGSEDKNAQITHVYCNNSKDKLIELGIYIP